MGNVRKYWPEGVVFLLELIILFLPTNVPPFTAAQLSIDTIVSMQIGVFVAYLAIKGVIFQADAREGVAEIRRAAEARAEKEDEIKRELSALRPNVNSIRAMTQWEFYERFGKTIEAAREAVDISHLDKHPPDENIHKTNYFEEFVRRVKANKAVDFRRLERLTSEKREWIEKLLEELQGEKNFSMRVVQNGDFDKLPHISVQLVDRKEVYLVAVSTHRSPHGDRDILIDSAEVYPIWEEYFERVLWERATLLIDKGRIVTQNVTDLALTRGPSNGRA